MVAQTNIEEMESQYLSMLLNVISVFSLTVLLAEYCETLDLEVSLIWPVAWSHMKALYFVNRLLPFVTIPFMIYYNLTPNPNPRLCKLLFAIPGGIGTVTCSLVSELVLYVRLYALSGRNPTILCFLIVNGLVVFVGCTVLTAIHVTSGIWHVSAPDPVIPGCFGDLHESGSLVVGAYALLVYSGLMTMSLCVYYGLRVYWTLRRSPLLQIFYRDGTFYFAGLTAMSIANGVSALLLPPGYRSLFAVPQVVAHSTLSTRMILHLKEVAKQDTEFVTLKNLSIFSTPQIVVEEPNPELYRLDTWPPHGGKIPDRTSRAA
ncbi:hypothetical protein FA15DRAFT_705891 [Coprinopsis marcescibilis]|uniref:DUF6533 domain-containing protein n=1 Tax=Coprinopsis marcescibilis TaxID=230819 RepID=A0A5C3KRD1_COPMA|nr:hypothetical protein FA15DRAFT_705891 [Coprinopsis marcescibilis]